MPLEARAFLRACITRVPILRGATCWPVGVCVCSKGRGPYSPVVVMGTVFGCGPRRKGCAGLSWIRGPMVSLGSQAAVA